MVISGRSPNIQIVLVCANVEVLVVVRLSLRIARLRNTTISTRPVKGWRQRRPSRKRSSEVGRRRVLRSILNEYQIYRIIMSMAVQPLFLCNDVAVLFGGMLNYFQIQADI